MLRDSDLVHFFEATTLIKIKILSEITSPLKRNWQKIAITKMPHLVRTRFSLKIKEDLFGFQVRPELENLQLDS